MTGNDTEAQIAERDYHPGIIPGNEFPGYYVSSRWDFNLFQ